MIVRVQFILVRIQLFIKHIDVRYHWIRDALDAMLLELTKVHTDDNDVDMMTKAVPRGKFDAYCEIARLAMVDIF
ncbi:hypothetical protein CR513_11125, partial [Mucuna pruriens]